MNKTNHDKVENLIESKNQFKNRIEINQPTLEMKEFQQDATPQNVSKETLNNNKNMENYT